MSWAEPDEKPPQAAPTDRPSCRRGSGVGFEIKEQTPALLHLRLTGRRVAVSEVKAPGQGESRLLSTKLETILKMPLQVQSEIFRGH